MGDFGDPYGSPNDPMFVHQNCLCFTPYNVMFRFLFHHANLDRHFQTWAFQQDGSEASKYFGYPARGYGTGNNLNDIVCGTDPFMNVLVPFVDADGDTIIPPVFGPISVKVIGI
jgi:hypothetical protein